MELSKRRKKIASYAAAACIVALLMWSRAGHKPVHASEEASDEGEKRAKRVSVKNGAALITIDTDARTHSGIIAGTPAPTAYRYDRSLYGIVRDPQPLRELRDRYAKSSLVLEKARLSLASSRQALERMKSPHQGEEGAARKDLRRAENTVSGEEENLRAARARLQALDLEARTQWGNGVVSWIRDHHEELDRVAEGKDLIIEIAAPADQRSSAPLTPARVNAASDISVPIELISSVPLIDPISGTSNFFYFSPAAPGCLIPGMTITVHLPAGPENQGALIPESAVVWWEGKAWIYVQKDQTHFIRREISTGMPSPGGWFLAGESAPGDSIVVQGAQLLLSEEFLSQYTIIEVAE